MNWQARLIGIYLFLCEQYEAEGELVYQRLSNNSTPLKFDDVEVLAEYLFGVKDGGKTSKPKLTTSTSKKP